MKKHLFVWGAVALTATSNPGWAQLGAGSYSVPETEFAPSPAPVAPADTFDFKAPIKYLDLPPQIAEKLEKDPNAVESCAFLIQNWLYNYAHESLQKGEPEVAIAALEKSLASNPKNTFVVHGATLGLSVLFERAGQPLKALDVLRKMADNPNCLRDSRALALVQSAEILAKSQRPERWEQGRAICREILQYVPGKTEYGVVSCNLNAYILLAQLSAQLKDDPQTIISIYEKGLATIKPWEFQLNYYGLWSKLARFQRNSGLHQQSLNSYRRLVAHGEAGRQYAQANDRNVKWWDAIIRDARIGITQTSISLRG